MDHELVQSYLQRTEIRCNGQPESFTSSKVVLIQKVLGLLIIVMT